MSNYDFNVIGKVYESTYEYTWKDVILYNLGIGAQAEDLPFVYERNPGGLKVIPSFALIASKGGANLGKVGKNIEYTKIVHGEQLIRIVKPLPANGKITRKGKLSHIYDKGSGAVFISEIKGYSESGEHLFDMEMTHFYIGGGRFGGDRGPKSEILNPPEGRIPDFSISYKTTMNQAVLYRLNGDFNPLHIDPKFAQRGGYKKPILHGLCTFGFATRAILSNLCEGDVTRFKEFKARFANVVYPGETLTTEGWKVNGKYIIQTKTENEIVVINNAYATVE
jgi:acyl dehydratase